MTKPTTINWIKIIPKEVEENETNEIVNIKRMIIDTGCPNSIVGNKWLNEYLKKMKIKKSDLKSKKCQEKFKFGPSSEYKATEKIEIPITIKVIDKEETFEEAKVEAFVIETEEIPLLCGKDTMRKWSTTVNLKKKEITINIGNEINKVKSQM
jgi:hypothetical protein